MLSIKAFTLPTYYPIGPANVYLIKNHPYTLIDTGPFNEESFKQLTSGLHAEGIKLREIKRIILTHGHSDHTGMSDKLQELSSAKVWIHHKELVKVQEGYWQLDENLLNYLGVPNTDIEEIILQTKARNDSQGSLLSSAAPLYGGELFEFDHFSLNVINTPGHSPGSTSLYESKTRTLFSGDNLLDGVTPNPVLEKDGKGKWIPVSVQYLDSLHSIINLKPSIVYPGHGNPFNDVENKASKVFSNYQSKSEELFPFLNKGWQTPYTLAKSLYPETEGFELFLALSKVVGVLDVMKRDKLLAVSENNGTIRFSKNN